jgi:hypothetical protein
MRESLKQELAKVLAKHYPYSHKVIYELLRRWDSIDLVMNGMDDSLEYGIAVEQACYYLRPNRGEDE